MTDDHLGESALGPEMVLLLRLSPVFPFTLLNYGLGLTSIRFWPAVWAVGGFSVATTVHPKTIIARTGITAERMSSSACSGARDSHGSALWDRMLVDTMLARDCPVWEAPPHGLQETRSR